MSDNISRQKLIEDIEKEFDGVCVYDVSPSQAVSDFIEIVDRQPPADQWIPCIVKLPEKSGEYWVTIIWSNKPTTSTGRYDAEKKMWDRYSYDPIAWKPYTYPEPYKGVE